MKMLISRISGIVPVLVWMLVLPLGVPAQSTFLEQFTPAGIWQADDGESRYHVTLCGDGTDICAKLIWIQPDKINDRNIQYLNRYVIYEGKRARPAEWRGEIDIYGTRVGGSVKILGQDKIQVTGCAYVFFCQGFTLDRIGDVSEVSAYSS